MDLDRMLENCRRDQWSVGDINWDRKPRVMSQDDETAIVQLFTDMAGIERLAGALFREQGRRVEDPRLKAIFATFVRDEVRHSHAAQMLADFYDVHHYREYRESESLRAFVPHFIDAVQYLSDDVANLYITAGELILDIALLRSINDYVSDDMSQEVMRLINRDESRHIAIDYHMAEYYSSDAYEERLRGEPRSSIQERARAAAALAGMLYRGQPFIRDVFIQPMDRVDPSGARLREAFKRLQLVGRKLPKARRPFARFLRAIQDLYFNPLVRPVLGEALGKLAGVGPRFLERMYTDEELERARRMSFDELAEDALSAKLS